MKEKKIIDLQTDFDPSIIKKMSIKELEILANQVREEIIDKTSINGGHLSSNLGTVELAVSLFHALDLPKDKVIFDVGHQSYAYKILSGRKLDSLRQENGIDGFQKKDESEYDCYEAGHSSTSIGAGMGMALTRDLNKENYHIVSVIGDSSLANGLSFEALNNLNKFNHQLLIILNDNEMSISTPVGGMNHLLRNIRVSKKYVSSKNKYKTAMKKNKFLQGIYKITSKVKDFIVDLVYSSNVFEDLGLYYYGIVDGHNIKKMVKAINRLKDINAPIILHIKTKKGKGYKFAEKDKLGTYHSVSSFSKENGVIKKDKDTIKFSEIYASCLDKEMEQNSKIISINPAMGYGSSLDKLMEKFPQRALDVGIAEEHALVFASGIANNLFHPYVSIYSTFLQRGYDQISHDICRMNLPVTLLVDHCGLVGKDGETHQGIYDFSYLSSIPNMTIAMAKDQKEAIELFNFSLEFNKPLSIRYPLNEVKKQEIGTLRKLEYGQWDTLLENDNNKVCVITFGPKINDIISKKINVTLVNAIFNYPLNENKLKEIMVNENIVIYDPYGTENGFASSVSLKLYELGYKGNIKRVSLPLNFVKKGSIEQQEKRHNVDLDSLINVIEEML